MSTERTFDREDITQLVNHLFALERWRGRGAIADYVLEQCDDDDLPFLYLVNARMRAVNVCLQYGSETDKLACAVRYPALLVGQWYIPN